MQRILTMLSTANFIAAGALFLLGFLQAAVPIETAAPGTEVAMEHNQELGLETRESPPRPEAELRALPSAAADTGQVPSLGVIVQEASQPQGQAEDQVRNEPEPMPEASAENPPATSRGRDAEQPPEPAGRPSERTEPSGRIDRAEPAEHIEHPERGRRDSRDEPAERAERGGRPDGRNAPAPAREGMPSPAGGSGSAVSAERASPDPVGPAQARTGHADAEPLEEVFVISEANYSPGSFLLSRATLRRIDLIAERAARSSHRIVVEGHADAMPVASNQRASYRNNQELSLLRASVIADRLVARGIDPARITTLGHGDSRPVASNLTPEGRALNRRVEVRLVPERGQAMAQTHLPAASVERQAGD